MVIVATDDLVLQGLDGLLHPGDEFEPALVFALLLEEGIGDSDDADPIYAALDRLAHNPGSGIMRISEVGAVDPIYRFNRFPNG